MRVLFESRLREVIFSDGSSVGVPGEVIAQAEDGQESETVERWLRKAGMLRPRDELLAVLPPAA